MKNNLKIVIALALIIGVGFWAVNSLQSHSYAGSALKFDVGKGMVSMTNSTDAPAPVQLVSAGTRSFAVVSAGEGISGSSTTQGSGGTATQLYEFALPSGASQFSVTRGTNVSFAATGNANLKATVQSLTENDTRTTMIVAAVVILGALFYISRTTDHRWIPFLRGRVTAQQVAKAPLVSAATGQGTEARAYGDNRSNIS